MTTSPPVPPSRKIGIYHHIFGFFQVVLISVCTFAAVVIITIIVCLVVDWYKHLGVAHLESLGARVSFGKSYVTVEIPRDRDAAVFLEEAAGDLRHLSRCYPMHLNLSRSGVTDADIEQLGMIGRLFSLNLAGAEITDKTLEQLAGSTTLHSLCLDGTKVTDTGLAHLEGVTQLYELSLSNTRITNEGLQHLRRLGQLSYLHLNDTQVSDAGLKYLEELPCLEHLYVEGTHVTANGVTTLQWAIPSCVIKR